MNKQNMLYFIIFWIILLFIVIVMSKRIITIVNEHFTLIDSELSDTDNTSNVCIDVDNISCFQEIVMKTSYMTNNPNIFNEQKLEQIYNNIKDILNTSEADGISYNNFVLNSMPLEKTYPINGMSKSWVSETLEKAINTRSEKLENKIQSIIDNNEYIHILFKYPISKQNKKK